MSANRWSTCPNCKAKRAERDEKLRQRASGSYGNMPQEQYLALLRKADAVEGGEQEPTVREDWEIGLDGLGGAGRLPGLLRAVWI